MLLMLNDNSDCLVREDGMFWILEFIVFNGIFILQYSRVSVYNMGSLGNLMQLENRVLNIFIIKN